MCPVPWVGVKAIVHRSDVFDSVEEGFTLGLTCCEIAEELNLELTRYMIYDVVQSDHQ